MPHVCRRWKNIEQAMFKRKRKSIPFTFVNFCWFLAEEGLTSCYKNIFVFVTIVELQDKSSVRNTAPAKVRLQCHFESTPPNAFFVSLHRCPYLSLLLTAATNKSKRACDTEGSVAGTFWVLCLIIFNRRKVEEKNMTKWKRVTGRNCTEIILPHRPRIKKYS